MTTQAPSAFPLILPLVRDRMTKRESVRVRLSAREKQELRRRARKLGCTVTELLLGLVMEHGDKVVVVER